MDKKTIISINTESNLPTPHGLVLNDPISRRKFIKRTGGAAAGGFLVLQGFRMNAWAESSGGYKIQIETSTGTWEDLPDSQPTIQTVVGKKANLRVVKASDNSLVTGEITWVLGGKAFVEFKHELLDDGYDNKMPKTNPVTIWFAQPSMKDPTASPKVGHTMTALFKVGGNSMTAQGKLVLLRPDPVLTTTMLSAASYYTTVDPSQERSGLPPISFDASVKDTKLPNSLKMGVFGICQLVDVDDRLYIDDSMPGWEGSTTKAGAIFEDDGLILDSAFLVPALSPNANLEQAVGPNAAATWEDQPGYILGSLIQLKPDVKHAYRHDNFSTFLMYKPEAAESKWVPLLKISWWFKSRAQFNNGTWSAANPDPADQGKDATAADCDDHPRWKQCSVNRNWVPYPQGQGAP